MYGKIKMEVNYLKVGNEEERNRKDSAKGIVRNKKK
jgi:hypothetical protein